MGFGQSDRESLSVAQQENLRYFEKWEATSICGELCIHTLRAKELDTDHIDWPELISKMEVICLS
jgi:branched-subunit amino acid transport protein AzlD